MHTYVSTAEGNTILKPLIKHFNHCLRERPIWSKFAEWNAGLCELEQTAGGWIPNGPE